MFLEPKIGLRTPFKTIEGKRKEGNCDINNNNMQLLR